jgi:hypothetical protein
MGLQGIARNASKNACKRTYFEYNPDECWSLQDNQGATKAKYEQPQSLD